MRGSRGEVAPKAPKQQSLGKFTEGWICTRIHQLGMQVDLGVTDKAQRKDRVRFAIKQLCIEWAIAGRGPDGKPWDFAKVFRELYGEAL